MRYTKRAGLLASAGAVVLLSGCGMLENASGSGDDADAPPPAPTTSAAEQTTPQNPAPAAGNAQTTPPGTKLRLGQRAVVPFEYAGRTGTIGITVTAIQRGDQAAFQQRFGSRAAGMAPYYIRYTVENVGGTDLSRSSAPLLGGVGPDGGSTGAVVIGSLPGCERGRPDESFAAAGAKYQTCRLQAARSGGAVAGAEYEEREGGYRDNPIMWMS
ncbi:hypothetical protein [Actinomadura sp. 7K507]|uniref:hypothetical protein n=1 Tax=Actinomadura sp. 7K507 TaxID=2530365 RepID=UPI0010534810|nr:hypothetical protein [Actinomadura sp. 7K507]TDC98437.1 hypothetical protein E1285_00470 [Actinomadura sp. 7K507]